MGTMLIYSETDNFVDELQAISPEVVMNKPKRDDLSNTDSTKIWERKAITRRIVCGVTTECCSHTLVLETNDWGFESQTNGLEDATTGWRAWLKRFLYDMKFRNQGLLEHDPSLQPLLEALASFQRPQDLFSKGAALKPFRVLQPSMVDILQVFKWHIQ